MRSYSTRNNAYQMLAPWDNRELNPPKSMLKTFQTPEFVVRNQDLSPREVRTTLPSFQHQGRLTMEQTRLLKESIGQHLYVARPDVISKLRKRMRANDQLKHGTILAVDLMPILREQNVHLDESNVKALVGKFDPNKTGRIPHADLMLFMADALNEYKLARDRSEFNNLPRYAQRTRVRHPSMTSSDFNLAPLPKRGLLEEEFTEVPGAYTRVKLNAAFNERRDAAIRIEIERSCKEYQGDIFYVFQNLKKKLLNRGEDLINSYKLKDIVKRHQLPINDALIDKMIERLDPFHSGSVSCKGFAEFLEKSLGLPNSLAEPTKTATRRGIPERPKWETSQPLKPIQANNKFTDADRKQAMMDTEQRNSREFERFMKLVTALRRRSKGLDQMATEAALETILKYNELFSLGFSESDVNLVLQKSEKNGFIEVDNIIDQLGELDGI